MSSSLSRYVRPLVAVVMLTTAAAHAQQQAPNDAIALRGYLSGNGLLSRGLHSEAAAEYRKFLSEQPEHPKAACAKYGLAVCLAQLNDVPGAVRELEPLLRVERFEFSDDARLLLAQCRLRSGDAAEAAAVVEELSMARESALAPDAAAVRVEALQRSGRVADALRAARDYETNWPAHAAVDRVAYFAALAERSQGQDADAATRLQRRLAASPQGALSERMRLVLAEIAEQRDALDDAQREYEQVGRGSDPDASRAARRGLVSLALRRQDASRAGELLKGLIAADASQAADCETRLLAARVELARGQADAALQALEAMQRECDALGPELAIWTGRALRAAGKASEAVAALSATATAAAPRGLQAVVAFESAVAQVEAGKLDEAARALTELRAAHGDEALAADALELLAEVELRRGGHDACARHCEQFLKDYVNHPRAAGVHLLSAENLLSAEKFADAAEAFGRLVAQLAEPSLAARAAYGLGRALHRLGRFDEARAALEKIAGEAAKQPELRDALLLLGDAALQMQDWRAAEQRLAEYVDRGGVAAGEALLKLGIARARSGQVELALETLTRLGEQSADAGIRAHGDYERGRLLAAAGRFEQARAAFEAALQRAADGPLNGHVRMELAGLAMQSGDAALAAAQYEQIAAAEGSPLSGEALLQRGQALLAQQKYAEAEAALSDYLARFRSQGRAGMTWAQLASAQIQQGKAQAALDSLEQAASEGETPPAALARLELDRGWCLRALDRAAEARAAYLRATAAPEPGVRAWAVLELAELDGAEGDCAAALKRLEGLRAEEAAWSSLPTEDQARGLYRLGVWALEARRHELAQSALKDVLDTAPASEFAGSAAYFAGEAAAQSGRHRAAAEWFERAATLPLDDATRRAALLKLGQSLAEAQLWPQSEAACERFLREFAGDALIHQARFGVGWARENQGRPDEAIAAYRAVTAAHTGETAARAQFQIGECLFAKREFDAAVAEFLKVDILYQAPAWSAAAVYEAGRCLEQLGRSAEARAQFNAVREKHAGTRWAQLAQERLEALSSTGIPGKP